MLAAAFAGVLRAGPYTGANLVRQLQQDSELQEFSNLSNQAARLVTNEQQS